jgi:MinD superfamily P-loop ATPase
VNKYDLNSEMTRRIEETCAKEGAQIVGRIPYDRVVTDAQVSKLTVIEYSDGAVSKEIRNMWERVARMLSLN